ncbi:MAG TPA: hypothetical protein VKR27_00805 [Acidimicrobiales bacterium]|nr:hypothetical protein [Acidimicrobiales bacterium]
MISESEREQARARAASLLEEAGIAMSADEAAAIEVVDFGLGELARTGVQILLYFNTSRCSAKELILFGGQTCPEHRHTPYEGDPGKEETFRVRRGTVYLYVEGPPTPTPVCVPPHPEHYTVWREIELTEGEQYTVAPDTKHWLQAPFGDAIVSEFGTESRSEFDVFTDPEIPRA